MKKIDIARIAGAIAKVSNNGLDAKKGLKLYHFYQSLKAVQVEMVEYEQKLKNDFNIQPSDNDPKMIQMFNEAFLEMANEEVDIKVEPFLTEEETVDILGKVLTMEGLNKVFPMVTKL